MLEPVKAALSQLVAQNEGGFLFQSSRAILRKEFQALQNRLNITPLRVLYYTRHSFASIMLSRGEEPMWVSVMLGHENLSTTLKNYTKYLPNQKRERAGFLKGLELSDERGLFDEL